MEKFLKQVLLVCACLFTLNGQANATGALPPLEEGWARVFIEFHPLVRMLQGTVYINNQELTVGEKEYLVVDLLPGKYDAHWILTNQSSLYPEKGTITLNKGDTRFFSASIKQAHPNYFAGGGLVGGAIGGAIAGALNSGEATNYDYISSVSELPEVAQQSPAKLNLLYRKFTYTKFNKDGGPAALVSSSK